MAEEGGVAGVIRSGRPLLIEHLGPEKLASYARDAEHLRLLEALRARSLMIVPLAAPSRTLGAITLATSESGRRLDEADLGVAVRLGRRSGTAVESARLYTERARIARTLQSALLPESLPHIPGVELHALYRAAGELNEVGGDFYDVFPYGGERWMLVIGDVCGKGARAAGVTALARHTLRAAAMLGQTPTGMLDTLHDALRRQPAGADLCTACLIALHPRGERARLTVTLAGHPLPVLIDAHGRSRQIGRPGTLLGVLDAIDISEAEAEMGAGETLLLYTDGVPDALSSSPQLAGHELSQPFARAPGVELAELLGEIEREVLQAAEGRLRDDIALLALRLAAGSRGDRMGR
jgi:serine phosphatase RsbU (regulator of sigma subunit)